MIYDKLTRIQAELKAPKSKFNSFGEYKYRSLEDIFEGVKPLLVKNGCTLTVSDMIVQIGERYYIQAEAELIDNETGEKVVNTALARESLAKKGMDEAQITGTTSSYARKYALNGLFLIDDTKDADTDENKIESDERAKKQEEIENAKIGKAKIAVLKKDIEEGVFDEDKLLAWFKVEKLEDITEKQFSKYAQKRNKK